MLDVQRIFVSLRLGADRFAVEGTFNLGDPNFHALLHTWLQARGGVPADDLPELRRTLTRLAHQQESLMTTNDQLLEFATRLEAASDELAKDLAALRADIVDKVPPETLAKLDAVVKRLEGMGVDPTNPVPAAG
jgi:hypothetical protein